MRLEWGSYRGHSPYAPTVIVFITYVVIYIASSLFVIPSIPSPLSKRCPDVVFNVAHSHQAHSYPHQVRSTSQLVYRVAALALLLHYPVFDILTFLYFDMLICFFEHRNNTRTKIEHRHQKNRGVGEFKLSITANWQAYNVSAYR